MAQQHSSSCKLYSRWVAGGGLPPPVAQQCISSCTRYSHWATGGGSAAVWGPAAQFSVLALQFVGRVVATVVGSAVAGGPATHSSRKRLCRCATGGGSAAAGGPTKPLFV